MRKEPLMKRSDLVQQHVNYGCPPEIRIVEAENGVALYVNSKLFVFNSIDTALTELKTFMETK